MKYIRKINGASGLAAVIGSPIQHSKSPLIYNHSFEKDDLNLVYLAFETAKEETIHRIESLKNLDVIGINITMPGKYEALQCVDRLNLAAEYVQAVNMIVPDNDEWVGYNTDGEGFWNSVKQYDVTIVDKNITLYGSGNTTRIILAQAVIEGVKKVNVVARGIERPLEIKALIERLSYDYPETQIQLIDLMHTSEVEVAVREADVIVQTTSVGMTPNSEETILEDTNWLNPNTVVCDIVYEPRQTRFMEQAQSRGCLTIGGIEMLVHQAALNYSLMTGNIMNTEKLLNVLTN